MRKAQEGRVKDRSVMPLDGPGCTRTTVVAEVWMEREKRSRGNELWKRLRNAELLVIAGSLRRDEYDPVHCTHRPSLSKTMPGASEV